MSSSSRANEDTQPAGDDSVTGSTTSGNRLHHHHHHHHHDIHHPHSNSSGGEKVARGGPEYAANQSSSLGVALADNSLTAAPQTPPFPHTSHFPLVQPSGATSPHQSPAGRRGSDARRSSTAMVRQHGHPWRSQWRHHRSGRVATPANTPTTRTAGRPRILVGTLGTVSAVWPSSSPRTNARAVADVERQLLEDEEAEDAAAAESARASAEEGTVHRYLKDWYSTFLRSRHARQAERMLAAYVAESQAEYSEEHRRKATVDAAVRRATGHTHCSAHHGSGAAIGTPPPSLLLSSLQTRAGGGALDAQGTAAATKMPFTAHAPPPSGRVLATTAAASSHQMGSAAASSLGERSPLLGKAARDGGRTTGMPVRPKTPETPEGGSSDAGPKAAVWSFWGRMSATLVSSFRSALLATSYREMVGLWGCVVMVLTGNALQVIALNFWLRQFPAKYGTPGNYTTLAVSSMMFAAFFLLVLGVYLVMERPDLSFLRHRHGALLLLGVGCADLACSCLTIYAASHTSEILQALFTSTAPIFTAYFQKHILRDPRRYGNAWVAVAFTCIVVGVLLASSYGFLHPLFLTMGIESKHTSTATAGIEASGAHNDDDDDDSGGGVSHWKRVVWSFLFFCSVIPSVVQNVVQTKYMLYFTRDPLFERWVITRATDAHGEDPIDDPDTLSEQPPQYNRDDDAEEAPCHVCGKVKPPFPTPSSSPLMPQVVLRKADKEGPKGSSGETLVDAGAARREAPPPPSSYWLLKRQASSPASLAATPTASRPPPSPLGVVADSPEKSTASPSKQFGFANATASPLPPLSPVVAAPSTGQSGKAASPLGRNGAAGRDKGAHTHPSTTSSSTTSISHHHHHHHPQPLLLLPGDSEPENGATYGTFASSEHGGRSSGKCGGKEEPRGPHPTVDNGGAYSVCCECTQIWMGYGHIVPGEDLPVKLALLAADTTVQAVGALLLLPMDALPFWGGSKSVSEAAVHFKEGLSCVLYCKHNMTFGLLYCLGFVSMYIGAVYLDQFSVTFCSMVTQLAAPCTALLLICYPSLNLAGDYTPWWLSCVAIVFLATGTILFTVWDQQTAEDRMEGENEVKKDYVKPFLVVERDGTVREFLIR